MVGSVQEGVKKHTVFGDSAAEDAQEDRRELARRSKEVAAVNRSARDLDNGAGLEVAERSAFGSAWFARAMPGRVRSPGNCLTLRYYWYSWCGGTLGEYGRQIQ